MDNLNDLKATWLAADTKGLPDAQFIMKVVKPFRNQKLNTKITIIIFSGIMMAFFAVMMYLDRARMPSTIIGDGLFVACLFILAYTNARSVRRFYTLNDCSNKDFINFLEQTRKNQIYYYKRTQVVCSVLYSLALLFYPFELLHNNAALLALCYVALIIGLARYWLVVRPKAYQKGNDKLQKTIDQTHKLIKQFG